MAKRGLHVTGIDSSPTLISLWRERLPDHEWLVEDMRLLQLPLQFDGVLAWDSFFHLRPDDQRRMFNVFDRHAAQSAVLMFNSGPAYGEGVGEYRGDPLYHASLSPDEYTALLDSIGFELVAHAVEDWQTGGGRTVWLTRARGNWVARPVILAGVPYESPVRRGAGELPAILRTGIGTAG